MTLDTMRMRYFLEIARAGSLTRAAKELHVAQSALSLHLRSLEDDMGTSLFDRLPRGVTLTEAGKILFSHCQSIMRAIEQAEHATKDVGVNPTGDVIIGIIFSLFPTLGISILEDCKKRFPGIRVMMCEGDSKRLRESLENQTHDIVIMPQDIPAPTAQVLFEESMYVIGPAGYFPSDSATIHPREVLQLPLIVPPEKHEIWFTINSFSEREGIQPNIVWRIEGLAATKHAIRCNLGFSLLTLSAISDGMEKEQYSFAKISNGDVNRVIVLDMATSHPATRAMKEVHQLILENWPRYMEHSFK
ncbi:LysR family transcriptional regulator [Vibrio mangrovi]|uniref:HTH-type transcriptional regulator GltC n=1 Tax=Vibrio mangrovi TaxID=474394 RepID=A0A1Y6ISX4_9VIBR|nr:LysR family transcriptional regulator [Vibrio mangrovi]MDW6003301.1 LysR family transcriptional regulator [Vibrio mangrovi]SMR99910.1 HTH-type transcriptional regulator GltC [Vibrio mangrovi]